MTTQTPYARNTWLEIRMPWGIFIRGKVICPDGKARIVRLAETADTFFSIPARLSYQKKTIAGFVSFASENGLSTNPVQWVQFTPTGKYRNIFNPEKKE